MIRTVLCHILLSHQCQKINEKESVISKLETGHLSPTFELAKKLEDFLEIELVKEYNEMKTLSKRPTNGNLTIGDIIEIKE